MSSADHIWTVHSLLLGRRFAPAHILKGRIVLSMAGHPRVNKGAGRETEKSKPASIVRCSDAPAPINTL